MELHHCIGTPAVRQLGAHGHAPRHRHAVAYASVVLRGGYEEAGDAGRFAARPGAVLVHAPFEAHLDRFLPAGADILNLDLTTWTGDTPSWGWLDDTDAIVRLAEHDAHAAARLLLDNLRPAGAAVIDWQDELAADILSERTTRLSMWAEQHGLAPATVSRGFRRVYGVSPARFRAERRGRLAWRRVVSGDASFATIAADLDFADQAHMTRVVRALTGRSPREWRAARRQASSIAPG